MTQGTFSRRLALLAGAAPLAIMLMAEAPAAAQNAAPPPSNNGNPAENEAAAKAEATAPTPPAAEGEGTGSGEIVVTGSRIASPNGASAVPITAISGEQFFKTGSVSVGDRLEQLPSVGNTFNSQNSTASLGTAGLELFDLRRLGTQRTLTLVNGRRFVPGDILNNAVSPDSGNFASNLIQSIEITTGGSSAIYGSDAIAGVVNVITRQDYDGIEARAQGGVSKYGDGGSYRASLLAGKNFAEGRGNIAADVEFSHRSDYYASERPGFRTNHGFVTIDSDPAGSANGSDGVPDRRYFTDIRSATIAPGGLINVRDPSGSCGRDALGAAFACTYLFQQDGTLVPQTGTRIGLAPNGAFQGGNGSTGREQQILGLAPKIDRYVVNVLGHYEVSDAFQPFFEGTYAHQDVTGSQSGPAFFQGSTIDANLERPRLDNPFLSAQARATLAMQLARAVNAGVNPLDGSAYDTPEDQAADLAGINDGSYRFNLYENLIGLGVRNERFKRDTFRIVGGVRGAIGGTWKYEVSGNYGQFKEKNTIQGNLNTQRFLLAIDSARNAAGQVVCRSQINPAFGADATAGSGGDVDNLLPADISACVPLNPFGYNNISPAARAYVTQDTVARGKITQAVASASITGDTTGFFELPGGPVGISLGGEYRRETNKYTNESLVRDGYTFYNALPNLRAPSFEVKEAYAEIQLPLLKDVPFFQELTVKGAGRFANYKGATGSVYAYNGSLSWKPIEDFRFRASYSRSVRAPNLTELYSSQTQNFALIDDPCSARNIATGSANRAANCASQGIPASYDFVYNSSLEFRSGGNPDLTAEKSNSYTLGGVFTPRFVRNLTFTVDYFHIQVNNVISAVGAQTVANQCYDQASTDNPFCASFQRAGAGGGPNGEVPFQIIQGSLLAANLNFAKLRTSGLDFDLAYNRRFGFGRVSTHVIYTHVLERTDFLNPADPTFADRLLGELGTPKDRFIASVDVTRGKLTAGYELRYVGKQFLSTAENIVPLNGLPPQNADYADRTYYPDVFYHNVRLALDVNDKFNIYAGVDNITNRVNVFGLTGVGTGSGIYDNRGRVYYTGIIAKF